MNTYFKKILTCLLMIQFVQPVITLSASSETVKFKTSPRSNRSKSKSPKRTSSPSKVPSEWYEKTMFLEPREQGPFLPSEQAPKGKTKKQNPMPIFNSEQEPMPRIKSEEESTSKPTSQIPTPERLKAKFYPRRDTASVAGTEEEESTSKPTNPILYSDRCKAKKWTSKGQASVGRTEEEEFPMPREEESTLQPTSAISNPDRLNTKFYPRRDTASVAETEEEEFPMPRIKSRSNDEEFQTSAQNNNNKTVKNNPDFLTKTRTLNK